MNNLDKILQYLTVVLPHPITVDGEEISKPVEHIKLSSTFFHKDSCISCGCCCLSEAGVYTQTEYNKIMSITKEAIDDYGLDFKFIEALREGTYAEQHEVNGKQVTIYKCNTAKNEMYIPGKDKVMPRCRWQWEKRPGLFLCGIHPVRSITCMMPHLKMPYHKNSKSTSLCISQYGRNWALKCPITFSPPATEAEFEEIKESRIDKLVHLHTNAIELNIETYLPQIIEYIEKIPFDNYLDYTGKDILNPSDVHKPKKLF